MQVLRVERPHDGAQVHHFVAFVRLPAGQRESLLDLLFGDAPRIDVLSRLGGIDRQERLAFVFEVRGDWALKETIKRQKVLRRWSRAGSLVQLFEHAIRRERLRVALFLVKLLENLARLDQLRDGFFLALRKFREITGQTDRLCLVDERLALLERPDVPWAEFESVITQSSAVSSCAHFATDLHG